MRETRSFEALRMLVKELVQREGFPDFKVPLPELLPAGLTENGANWHMPRSGGNALRDQAFRRAVASIQDRCDASPSASQLTAARGGTRQPMNPAWQPTWQGGLYRPGHVHDDRHEHHRRMHDRDDD